MKAFVSLGLVLLSLKAFSQTSFEKQTLSYLSLPIKVETMNAPIPVKTSDGKWNLSYTLLITNFSFSDLTLFSVSVADKNTNKVLNTYDSKDLQDYYIYRTLLPTPPRSTMPGNKFPEELTSGRTAVLFFWLKLDDSISAPSQLTHTLTFKNNPLIKILKDNVYDNDSNMVFKNYIVTTSNTQPLVISPPVKGTNWLCGNGPAYNTSHQYLSIRNGKIQIAQRFAIDFQKVDMKSNTLPNPFPDTINNRMFYGYGEKVYAVSDGVIVDIKDDIPDNVPQADGRIIPAIPITDETVAGNVITLKVKEGYYVFYAHLQPGSITVNVGDEIRAGQVLGLLGNSGNSVGAHLHFHIGNSDSLNDSEGVPFVFKKFSIKGRLHIEEIPINRDIVDFE